MKALSPLIAFPRSHQDIDLDRALAFHEGNDTELNYVTADMKSELKRWYGLYLLKEKKYDAGIKILESLDVNDIQDLDKQLHEAYILLQKLENELRNENLQNTLSYALDLLKILGEYQDKKSIDFQAIGAELLYDLAYIHNEKGEFDSAEKELSKSQKLFEKLAKKDNARFGEGLLATIAASTLVYKSRIKKHNILVHYHAATTALISELSDDSGVIDELIQSLKKEGDLLREMGNNKEAIKYYTKALEYMRKRSVGLEREHLSISLSLAKSLTQIDKKKETGYSLLDSLKILAEKLNAKNELNEIETLLEDRPKNEFINSMKKLFFSLAILLVSLSVNAQLVMGHRGSLWGVENTKTSFINGALKGFHGLECDIKVTKDGHFIISHDNKLNRLNPDSIDVTQQNYSYLLKVPLSQIRDGKYYEGNLCSLDEYLDICNQFNVIPLIEIKFCSNIYSNNSNPEQFCYDGIPALMNLIKFKGLENKAILLTSMRGVLTEIRKSYPNAQLQCLVHDKWEHLVDFCVQNNLDIDVRRDADTTNLVKTFHDKGLKVNVWCVDTPEEFKKFSELGVDYITTNSYFPSQQN